MSGNYPRSHEAAGAQAQVIDMSGQADAAVSPADEFAGRHPGTLSILRWFQAEHLTGQAKTVALSCQTLALQMVRQAPDSAELVAGLRKLLEAKDCFVRSVL